MPAQEFMSMHANVCNMSFFYQIKGHYSNRLSLLPSRSNLGRSKCPNLGGSLFIMEVFT